MLFIQGQKWSISNAHFPVTLSWWARGGLTHLQCLQKRYTTLGATATAVLICLTLRPSIATIRSPYISEGSAKVCPLHPCTYLIITILEINKYRTHRGSQIARPMIEYNIESKENGGNALNDSLRAQISFLSTYTFTYLPSIVKSLRGKGEYIGKRRKGLRK